MEEKTKILDKKKVLYTVCFVLLGMVDFVRHTQQQEWWGPFVNFTGIILMIITATAYKLREFKCRFSYIWSAIMTIALIISAMWGDDHILGVYKWTIFTAIINVWMIGILGYRVVRKIFVEKTLRIRWNLIGSIWAVMTVLMMCSPYRAVWPLWFFLIFGLFYLTRFEKKDFDSLREAMADGVIITFFVLQVYAYGYRPFDMDRYKGAFSNSNITALHYLVTYVAILIKIHFLVQKKSARFWKIIFFIGAAGLLDFQILTMGRTVWMTSIVITVLFGIVVMRRLWDNSWKKVLGCGAALGFSVMILFPAVFATARWLPPLRHHPIWYDGEWGVQKVHSFDPPDSEKYTDFDEFMGDLLGRFKIITSFNNPLVLKVHAEEEPVYRPVELSGPENLTESLRIRLTIYKAYLENLNWIGHKPQEGHYIITDINAFVWHPQNVWIQMAYYYGIPTGILFLVLSVLILAKQTYAAGNRKNAFNFIPLFISIVFFMDGLMEIVWIVGQLILFLLFFTQHPQFMEEAIK